MSRLQDAWEFHADAKALAVHASILRILKLFYQRDPIPFQTLNVALGTEQSTHSDAVHFHSVPHRFMCGVWVALEDIVRETVQPVGKGVRLLRHVTFCFDVLDGNIPVAENRSSSAQCIERDMVVPPWGIVPY